MIETIGYGYDCAASNIGYFDDPLVTAELEGMVDEMDLLGYDVEDPELMGNIFKDLANKIKGAVAKKKGSTLSVGPQGIQLMNPVTAPAAAPAPVQSQVQTMLKNPLVLGGAAVAVIGVIVILKKKKRGRK